MAGGTGAGGPAAAGQALRCNTVPGGVLNLEFLAQLAQNKNTTGGKKIFILNHKMGRELKWDDAKKRFLGDMPSFGKSPKRHRRERSESIDSSDDDEDSGSDTGSSESLSDSETSVRSIPRRARNANRVVPDPSEEASSNTDEHRCNHCIYNEWSSKYYKLMADAGEAKRMLDFYRERMCKDAESVLAKNKLHDSLN